MNVLTIWLALATLCLLGFAVVIAYGDRLERRDAEQRAAESASDDVRAHLWDQERQR